MSDSDAILWTADAADRISAAVKWVENNQRAPNVRARAPRQIASGSSVEWVRILCASLGAHGYPGLIQLYDPGTQTFSDLGGASTTAGASIGTGAQTVTPASMTGINPGTTLLAIDGLCTSESVTVTATNASATATAVVSQGKVVSVVISNQGSGYTSAPTVRIVGDGTGATATATVSGGKVTVIVVNAQGSGYTGTPTVRISASPGPSTTFTATFSTALVVNGVKSITVTSPGSGYSGSGIAPTITFTGGGGTGAAATANLDAATGDVVDSFTITNPGSGYTSPPTVVVDDSGTSGTGAAGTAVLSGPIRLYLSAAWVQFQPADYTPVQNDIDGPVIFLARQERSAGDGLMMFLALGGQTVFVVCLDGSSFTFYAGRLITSTGASS